MSKVMSALTIALLLRPCTPASAAWRICGGVHIAYCVVEEKSSPPNPAVRPASFDPHRNLVGRFPDRPTDVLAPETHTAMHLSRMRPAPQLASAEITAGIGKKCSLDAAHDATRRLHVGTTAVAGAYLRTLAGQL